MGQNGPKGTRGVVEWTKGNKGWGRMDQREQGLGQNGPKGTGGGEEWTKGNKGWGRMDQREQGVW